jgi:hypothetical protein
VRVCDSSVPLASTLLVLSAVRTVSATCRDRFLSAVMMQAVPLLWNFRSPRCSELSVLPVGTVGWRVTVRFTSVLFRRYAWSKYGPDSCVATCQCCRRDVNLWYGCVCGYLALRWVGFPIRYRCACCHLALRWVGFPIRWCNYYQNVVWFSESPPEWSADPQSYTLGRVCVLFEPVPSVGWWF